MTRPFVIINPESAGGSTRLAWPGIASDLRTHFGPFACVFTTKEGHATELATEAARQGVRLIIACGGDGTISEVGNGILISGKEAVLGILPSGTGGDFRRTLGIPSRPRDAAKLLRTGRTGLVDVGRVSFTGRHGERESRFFLGVASFGLSAEVIQRVKGVRLDAVAGSTTNWLSGRAAFAGAMLQTAMQAAQANIMVQLDDKIEQRMSVTNLSIANARYFGGGMKIAPEASLTDGKFDVIAVGHMSPLKIVTNAPRIYLGAHLRMPEVSFALATKVAARPVDNDADVAIEVDGELPGCLPATFQIVPKALRVRCPA